MSLPPTSTVQQTLDRYVSVHRPSEDFITFLKKELEADATLTPDLRQLILQRAYERGLDKQE